MAMSHLMLKMLEKISTFLISEVDKAKSRATTVLPAILIVVENEGKLRVMINGRAFWKEDKSRKFTQEHLSMTEEYH